MILHHSRNDLRSGGRPMVGVIAKSVDKQLQYEKRRRENALKYKEAGKRMKEEHDRNSTTDSNR